MIAVERVELARAQYGLERSALFPAVDLGGSATRQRMPGAKPDRNSISESSSLSLLAPAWEIDLWGKLAARTEAARRDVLANEALVEAVRISLVAQVSTLYLEDPVPGAPDREAPWPLVLPTWALIGAMIVLGLLASASVRLARTAAESLT